MRKSTFKPSDGESMNNLMKIKKPTSDKEVLFSQANFIPAKSLIIIILIVCPYCRCEKCKRNKDKVRLRQIPRY